MNLPPREKDKLLIAVAAYKAFSSEVGTGSREENALKMKSRSRP